MTTNIPYTTDVTHIQDERGSFTKIYCSEWPNSLSEINQVNISVNHGKGTVRGLHFQLNEARETKILSVITGSIFDVAVCIDPNDANFKKVFKFVLSSSQPQALHIPSNYAHGYQTLEANSTLIYLHKGHRIPESELGVNILDPELNIEWPLPVSQISKRDKTFMNIRELIEGNNNAIM